MSKLASTLLLASLSACSNVGEYERELTGAQAAAWALCKKEFGVEVRSAPPYGERSKDHILFAWNADDARRNGGPIMCETNGTGTVLIEVRVSAGF